MSRQRKKFMEERHFVSNGRRWLRMDSKKREGTEKAVPR